MVSNKHSEDKEERQMAVSMAVVPLLKGKAAEGIMKDFKNSELKSYSDRERKQTNTAIAEILRQKKMERDTNSPYCVFIR